MKLSVIIPTRNRAALLKNTLNSIVGQELDKSIFEVIVVDNNSTDNTKEVCDEFKDKLNITCFFEAKLGLHNGRHAGMKLAKSEILVYADDDIEALPTWLNGILDSFNLNEKIALVGGNNYPKFEQSPPFWLQEKWNSLCKFGKVLEDLSILDFGLEAKEFSPYYVFGCNFSIRKKILLEAGGFHPDGMPFELIEYRGDGETYISEYISKNDYITYFNPKASIHHLVTKDRLTQEYFFKRRYTQGISDAYTFLRSKRVKEVVIPNKYKALLKSFLGLSQIDLLNELNSQLKKSEFERTMDIYHKKGYDYLLKCYDTNSKIKDWVHKENYF